MSQRKNDVIVVGELNIDLILSDIAKFPEIGKEVLANEMKQTLGSSSAIFANNLSILGTQVSYLGKVGTDGYADQIFSVLQQAGVDVSNILRSHKLYTGITVALNFGNNRAMVTYPGAMCDLTINDISDDALKSSSHMHLSSLFLQTGLIPDIVELFKRAKSFGLTTSLDPQWDPEEKWDINLKALLPFVDVFLPNETELKNLTGSEFILDGINVIKPFSNVIVVKNGTEGAIMWDGEKIINHPACLNENVVDAIGAGDSFDAGFINGFINRKSLEKCLELGILMGAVNTTAAGGTGAFQSRDAVKKCLLERFNKRLE
jgi:sugar/nucleoside kinase (ribokinase family)